MIQAPAPRVLLGPQRPVVNLGDALGTAGVDEGPVAVISAGWQEAEGDIADVQEACGLPLEDLRLYQRAESLFTEEPAIAEAYRMRQDRLIEQQRLYRLRLRPLAQATRAVWRSEGFPFYEAIARPSDAPQRTLFVLVPLATTAVGGVASNLLFGSAREIEPPLP